MRVGVTRIIAVLLAALALWCGLPTEHGLRRWTFDETRPLRFRDDMERGFYWGRRALDEGYLALYDTMRNQDRYDAVWLDYAPLRLAVMTLWAKIDAGAFPDLAEYQNTFEFAKPVLWFNTTIELIAAIGMFMLVRHWCVRSSTSPPTRWTGTTRGLIAAMLLWLNPASLISAYGWATWDIWVVAFYVWAVYLACADRWWLAGLVIAIGAMFKGQILAVSVVLIVWPLVRWKWREALYLLGGLVFGTAIVVSPWMLRRIEGGINWWSIAWVTLIVLGVMGANAFLATRKQWRPWFAPASGAIVGVAILLCMPLWDASDAWYQCGFAFGTHHFDRMTVGLPNNLPALLDKRFEFGGTTDMYYVVFSAFGIDVTLKALLRGTFVLLTIACGIAAARHDRRDDPRFAVAIVTPWLLFFVFPLQIHERYLLFAAACSACFVVAGWGPTLAGVFLSLVSACSTLAVLLKPDRVAAFRHEAPESVFVQNADALRAFTVGLHPDIAWAVLVATGALLYLSFTRSRRDETRRIRSTDPEPAGSVPSPRD